MIQVTDRGEPIARLVPVEDESPLARLERQGRLSPVGRDAVDLPPPLELESGEESLTAEVLRMRDEERS